MAWQLESEGLDSPTLQIFSVKRNRDCVTGLEFPIDIGD